MKVILISGKAQHGKDTTAGFLKEYLEEHGKRVLITHYGDLLKYVCRTFLGWDGQKDEAGRSLLQHVGSTVREQDQNFWVRFVGKMLTFFHYEWDYVLIPDCRFPNEVDLLKDMFHFWPDYEAIHFRVVRPDFDNGLTPKQKAHPSETALDWVTPDFLLENWGGLDDLRREVRVWARGRLNVPEVFQ